MASTMNTATIKLNTGFSIPQLGLGTWQATDNSAYTATLAALKAGYRHIDTAAIYGNEAEVGKAIKESGVPREQLFITTKVWGTQHREPEVALAESLERLGLEYVDLLLMHWPVPLKPVKPGENKLQVPMNEDGTRAVDVDFDFVKTWILMQELPKSGKVKTVGVSNFSVNNLKKLAETKEVHTVPAANQCECHPLLPQNEVLEYCNANGIVFEAYSPLGSSKSPLLTNETLKTLAEKYNASIAQLLINWAFKRGYVVLPKSSNPDRVVKNAEVVELSQEDFDAITNLVNTEGEQRLIAPDWTPFPIFE